MSILKHHIFWSSDIKYSVCFKETNSLSSFNTKLKKVVDCFLSTKQFKSDEERNNAFKSLYGDGGEVFVEVFIQLTKYCPQIKIYDYVPTPVNYEGVDAYAKRNKDNVAIQVKWYNPDKEISGRDGIMSFKGKAVPDLLEMGTIPNMTNKGPKNLIVITSGKGITQLAEDNSNELIQVINKDDIKRIVGFDNDGGNSFPFWTDAYNIVKETEDYYKGNTNDFTN